MNTRTGSGQTGARNGNLLMRNSLAGAPQLALARMGPEITIFLLGTHWQEHHNWLWQDARNGHCLIKDLLAGTPKIDSGQIGAARNCHFLMWSLLAGAPELALARLGPEMVTFLLGASEQELQNRLWPDWGQKCSFFSGAYLQAHQHWL